MVNEGIHSSSSSSSSLRRGPESQILKRPTMQPWGLHCKTLPKRQNHAVVRGEKIPFWGIPFWFPLAGWIPRAAQWGVGQGPGCPLQELLVLGEEGDSAADQRLALHAVQEDGQHPGVCGAPLPGSPGPCVRDPPKNCLLPEIAL